ncbi:MAG TPA: tyrosine--tRNA ligase, partial [Candidatus Paceibacterota bacterium]|nr:tyrosine--tRNA ligase [Candidatus Paceibacterota bacterium]
MNEVVVLDSGYGKKVDAFLEKGVSEIFPNRDSVKNLLLKTEKPLTLYAGFDPTAPTLHLGHTIQLRKLKQWQDMGHKVVFLVGDFTALIGDPTDKLAARTQLTEREVKQNLRTYKAQAGKIIRFSGKNKAVIRFNAQWLKKMKLKDIISLSSLVTVDQMQKRDMFDRRTQEGKPIYMHEFLYPLMQGYDSVALKVDGEVGGTDQTFNMLMGRTLEQKLLQKEKFVITMKLLEDGSGKKMGKSEGNMVALDEDPSQMYGKVMSWPDSVVPSAFELLTDLDTEAVTTLFTATPHP